MTWNETHERMRIIHEVETVSAADLSGAVPWREEWAAYFDGPHALVAALRSRWQHMCEVQLDGVRNCEELVEESIERLRRTQAGIVAILRGNHDGVEPEVLNLSGPTAATEQPKRRHLALHGGPVLPSTPRRR